MTSRSPQAAGNLTLPYSDTFKRNYDRTSYYLIFSANPLREYVKFLSRRTRWVAGSSALSASGYRFLHLQTAGPGPLQETGYHDDSDPVTPGRRINLLAYVRKVS